MQKVFIFCLLAFGAVAQQDIKKSSEMKIRVEKDLNGKKNVTEKIINTSNLSDAERDRLIIKIQDSVMANKGKAHTKVMIESQCTDMKGFNENQNIDGQNKVIVKKFSDKNKEGRAFDKEIQIQLDGDATSLSQLHLGLDEEEGFSWNTEKTTKKASNILGIRAYPNNPNNELLNVRFDVPTKGDVSILVMDTTGKTIAKEEIKDFSGEYVGQLRIGSQKGTFFVMVVQNGDGNVKRVVAE